MPAEFTTEAKSRYQVLLRRILRHEGGFSNHPKDPGGATNFGITQRTYDAWRMEQGNRVLPVSRIQDHEVESIYEERYWDAIKGPSLPVGLDYAMLDFAVNSGPYRAIKTLQTIVGVKADGFLGPRTRAAMLTSSDPHLIEELCEHRLRFLQGLSTWSTFGRGWQSRVDNVRMVALRDRRGLS